VNTEFTPATGDAPESRSGLDPWKRAELPEPPRPRGLAWIAVAGPGVIVLGASIGSGEFLLGPAAFVRYGLTLLWVTAVAVVLQTIFNMELVRYTMATGEPAFTGFMRTKPHSTFWAWFYALLYFLQMGWPGWAGSAAGAVFFLFTRQIPGDADREVAYWIGVGGLVACIGILLIGRRIERTLEMLNWVMVTCLLSGMVVFALIFVPAQTWIAGLAGLGGFDPVTRSFHLLPAGADWFLIAAFAAYSGAGGVINITLSNWARDKGYGMGGVAGFIPALVGGSKVNLAHTGYTFTPDEQGLDRWRGWWRVVRVDQWGIFFTGAMLGMVLPAMLYVTFLEPGVDIRGLGIAAALAHAVEGRAGLLAGMLIALMGAWILFKTQLDIIDGMTRAITDILWTGSRRMRAWRGGDVRIIYYGVLVLGTLWGAVALRFAQPIRLLQLGANFAAIIFVIASLHLLYVNTKLLPPVLRPPLWRRIALVANAVFYGAFATLWISSLI
jgi:hypothetical protein